MHPAFQFNQYLIRRQVLALTGKFRVYNPSGEMVLFSQQKMFKLREDIRIYSDESKAQEVLYIQARNILDFSAAYDVIDSLARQKVGTWRRKGFRSLVRDAWEMLDANDRPTGILHEDNVTMALLRRFLLGRWLPQNYDLLVNGSRLADLRQRFNPIRYELDIDLTMDPGDRVDPRMAVAAGILLATIEGRQE